MRTDLACFISGFSCTLLPSPAALLLVAGLAVGCGPQVAPRHAGLLRPTGCGLGNLDACRRGCLVKDAEACLQLGLLAQAGVDRRRNLVMAEQAYRVGCALKNARACAGLAAVLAERSRMHGSARRFVEEARAMALACEGGLVNACSQLGTAYEAGEGVGKDVKRAAKLYRRACDAGNGPGCLNLAFLQLGGRGGVPRDEAAARSRFKGLCAGGLLQACANLGNMYVHGYAAPKDLAGGRALLARACKGGLAWGCDRLADALSRGPDGAKNADVVRGLRQRACRAGLLPSCSELAHSFDKVAGLRGTFLAAAAYWHACQHGHWLSCSNLSNYVSDGRLGAMDPGWGVALLARACKGNYGPACGKLGARLLQGLGVAQDATLARRFLDRACQLDHAPSCTIRGMVADKKEGDRGLDPLRKACDAGNLEGCHQLAVASVTTAPQMARELFERGCEKKHAGSCNRLGLLYKHGQAGLPRDLAKAAALFTRACEGKNPAACSNLGQAVLTGKGLKADRKRGLQLLRRSCGDRFSSACLLLGLLHLGASNDHDPKQAARWLEKACETGDARGCVNVGLLFERGYGVPKDPKHAVAIYRKSCTAKQAAGCGRLGRAYELGLGVSRDLTLALENYQKACRGRAAEGCYGVGRFMQQGLGASVNFAKSIMLFKVACIFGSGDACNELGEAYFQGQNGAPKHVKTARDYFDLACIQRAPRGCVALAGFYLRQNNSREARRLLGVACRWRDAEGCFQLSGLLQQLGRVTEAKAARSIACGAGHARACPRRRRRVRQPKVRAVELAVPAGWQPRELMPLP